MSGNRFIGFTFSLFILLGASQASAILDCADCACGVSCSAFCFTDTGNFHCGDFGACGPCGGGCFTMADASFLKALMQAKPSQVSSVGYERGRATARLTSRLTQYVEEKRLGEVYAGETGFLASRERNLLQVPALAFLGRQRLEEKKVGGGLGTPDLVAEVLSSAPATAGRVRNWLAAGTRAVLVLDPQTKTLTVYHRGSPLRTLGAGETLEMNDIVPGWALRVGDLFAE